MNAQIVIGIILLALSGISYPLLVKPMTEKYGKLNYSRRGSVIVNFVKFLIYGSVALFALTMIFMIAYVLMIVIANNFEVVSIIAGTLIVFVAIIGAFHGDFIWKKKHESDVK